MRLGLVAGVLWSCGFILLMGAWRFPFVLVLPITGAVIGAVVTRIAARGLVAVTWWWGTIGVGLIALPICAFLFGFLGSLLSQWLEPISRGPGTTVVAICLLNGNMYAYASLLSPLAFVVVPLFCLTVVWIRRILAGASP